MHSPLSNQTCSHWRRARITPAGHRPALPSVLARQQGKLTAESERVMRHEAEFAEYLKARGEGLPARFPSIESAEAPANFRNRVVKPYRGVLHLVAGIAQVLDDVERQLALGGTEMARMPQADGFGAYPDKPRLLLPQLLLTPELSIAAINRARRLEAGLPYLKAQRPKPEEVVRLRWHEANGQSVNST